MFRVIFSCRKRNVQSLVGAITRYCNSKGFDNFLVSDYQFTKMYGVGVSISLKQHKFKTLCPDDIRNELIHLVTKYYTTSHLLCYVIKDTSLFKTL